MNFKLPLLFAVIIPLLSACMFIGAATMPAPKPDRIAKVTTMDNLHAGVSYKYKILLTGKNYGFNIHSDPLAVILIGRWREYPIDGAIFINSLEGTFLPKDFRLSRYDVNPSGVIVIKDKVLTIDLKWTRVENGKEIVNSFQFNGEYELELLPNAHIPLKIQNQENEPRRERPILKPVEGDTLGKFLSEQQVA